MRNECRRNTSHDKIFGVLSSPVDDAFGLSHEMPRHLWHLVIYQMHSMGFFRPANPYMRARAKPNGIVPCNKYNMNYTEADLPTNLTINNVRVFGLRECARNTNHNHDASKIFVINKEKAARAVRTATTIENWCKR